MRLWLLALVATSPAWAQERPETTPTRDVDVVYRAVAGGKMVDQRSRFAPSMGRIRIDTPSPGLYVIVNRQAHTMDMVSGGDRSVLEMPYDPAHTVGGVASDRAWSRIGADTVADTPCTEWQSSDAAGHPTAICVTQDGVLLRARAAGNVIVQAVRVAYGPIEPSVFAIPPDFSRRQAHTP